MNDIIVSVMIIGAVLMIGVLIGLWLDENHRQSKWGDFDDKA